MYAGIIRTGRRIVFSPSDELMINKPYGNMKYVRKQTSYAWMCGEHFA